VVTDGNGLWQDDKAAAAAATQRPLRNDVVQQHGVHSTLDEVGVGMDVVIVRNGDETRRVTRGEEYCIRDGRAERPDVATTEIGQAVDATRIRGPHRQHLAEFEIGDRDGMLRAARRCVLDSREAEREVAAFYG